MKKFKDNLYYINLFVMFTPSRIIQPNMIFSGKEWKKILVYGVGNSFNEMFKETTKPL
jgi:hypothetical protein